MVRAARQSDVADIVVLARLVGTTSAEQAPNSISVQMLVDTKASTQWYD